MKMRKIMTPFFVLFLFVFCAEAWGGEKVLAADLSGTVGVQM